MMRGALTGGALKIPNACCMSMSRLTAAAELSGIPLTGVLQTGVFGIVEMCLALMRKLVLRDHWITKPGFSHPGQTFCSGHAKTPVSKTHVYGTPDDKCYYMIDLLGWLRLGWLKIA